MRGVPLHRIGEVRPLGPKGKAGERSGRLSLAVVAALASLAGPLLGQVGPRYHPLQLDCSRYRQQVRSTIQLQSRGERSREETLRDGILVLRAVARDSGIALEAWFDTLKVQRDGSGERLTPDTDGLIGGRYLGLLAPQGGIAMVDRPFVPDEVAQVADLGDALAELLPPLAPSPLAPGAGWRDGFGMVIQRLADESWTGRRVERYRLTRKLSREEQHLLPDSTTVLARREETETGSYDWSPELGMVRWERSIAIEVDIPAGGPVRQPFRTRIDQQVTVERVSAGGSCR